MGNLASGHFKPTNNIQEQHNDRTLSPSYLIPQEFRGQNEVNRHSKQAMILKNQIIENAHETYLITFKQKSQAKSYQWSLVVNTKETTTMSDLEKLAEHFEIKYGFQCYQIAIHRDEGYMDENNQPHINHHAHMEFITLNKKNGKNMMRKAYLSPKNFREIQTEIAQILGMERGTDKRVSGTKRIEPHKYAQMKEKERKKLEAKEKEINTLENKLQEQNKTIYELQERPTTEQYSQLEQTNSEQTQTIQEKDKEIATLNTLNAKLEKANQDLQRPSLLDTIKDKYIDSTKNKREIERLQKEKEELKKQYEEVQQERDALKEEIATALDTANEHSFYKEPTLQKAVESIRKFTDILFSLDLINDNPTDKNAEKQAEKYKHLPVFTKLWNAIKLFYNIIEKLFGDKNAKKDHQDIINAITELQERPTKQELQAKDKEIATLKNDQDWLKLFLKNKERDLKEAQDQIKTLESNETALKNDLHAKESTIQAKEKTINELKKQIQDLKDNYNQDRERMKAENKRLQEQGLEKIHTQKDYEDLKKRHEKEIEALKKEIQEQDKTIKKNNTYRRIAENARSRKAQQKRKTTTPTPSPTPQETYTYSKRM
ncbi:hypothetical protein [Helicobacter pylori]|uniref:hypothetical protein n=1 Tax=Helicobacter pylori TaxID=210 RepID=UPI00165AD6AD|nr:hypothetical protein [Helicobacter pylori]